MKEHIAKVRETMVEQVARKYGLESGVTISFAILVEQEGAKQEWIAEMYETLMNQGVDKHNPLCYNNSVREG